MASSSTVRLENMTRSVFHFPVVARGPGTKDHPGRLSTDEANSIVLGDSADRGIPAGLAERNAKCPDPIVEVTMDRFNLLSDTVGKALMDLVRAGAISMQIDGRVVTGHEAVTAKAG